MSDELSRPVSEARWRRLGPGPETPSPCSLVRLCLPSTACDGPSARGRQPPRKAEREGLDAESGALALTPCQLCVRHKGLNLLRLCFLLYGALGAGTGGLERACKRAGVPEVWLTVIPGLGTDTWTRSSPRSREGQAAPRGPALVVWGCSGLWVLGGRGRKPG